MGALAVLVASAVTTAAAVLAAAATVAAEYNVVAYGARPGAQEDSASAFHAAWAAACNDDTGRWSAPVVRVPAGTFLVSRAYFGGPCRSAAGVVVAVDGTVLAPPAVDSTTWIQFHYAHGLTIRGVGTLDGNGMAYWACKKAGRRCPPGTTTLDISQSNNVTVSRLTLLNSKSVHLAIFDCTGVTLLGVRIVAPADSPNTPIHVVTSRWRATTRACV